MFVAFPFTARILNYLKVKVAANYCLVRFLIFGLLHSKVETGAEAGAASKS
jgi:hypothetical protein